MHPIYDSLEYPFAIPGAADFHRVLYTVVPAYQEIDRLYKSCRTGLPALHQGNQSELWKEVLENLARLRLIRKLCSVVLAEYPSQDLIDAINKVDAAKSVVEALIISESILMMDRKDLRRNLDLLANESNLVKILIVRGDPDSGKTHSNYLFEQVATEKGGYPIYVSRDQPDLMAVLHIIFAEVGGPDMIPYTDTTGIGWYQVVCSKLNALAIQHKKQLWIAVDDLGSDENGQPLLDDHVREFFNQFALLMKNASMRKNFRLMLIHYPDTKPARWDNNTWTHVKFKESDIQEPEVEEAIFYWHKTKEKNMLQDEIRAKAKEIVSNASLPQGLKEEKLSKLQRIYDAVNDFLMSRA